MNDLMPMCNNGIGKSLSNVDTVGSGKAESVIMGFLL